MSTIKDKPLKKKHTDPRITIDVIHNDIISNFDNEDEENDYYLDNGLILSEYYNNGFTASTKKTNNKTQVFKDRIKRISNNNTNFKIVNGGRLENKHILIVDDIITTGATIEDCSNTLLEINGIKLSLATMSITD